MTRLVALVAVAAAVVFLLGIAYNESPLFALPRPSGPFAVGTRTLTFARHVNAEETRPGNFSAQVWYPAEPSNDRAPYSTGGSSPRAMLFGLIRTQAARDATIIARPRTFPLIVYIAGWGLRGNANTTLAQDLASQGYVVVALDDVTQDSPASSLDGPLDISSTAAYSATLKLAHAKLKYEGERVSSLLDRVLTASDPQTAFLAGRLDSERIGSIGFSFGGAVALDRTREDSRFKAAVNLDGWLFGVPAFNRRAMHRPYLLIGTKDTPTIDEDLHSTDANVRNTAILNKSDERDQLAHLQQGGIFIITDTADHGSFTDDLTLAMSGRPKYNHADAVRQYVVAFINETLKGIPARILTSDFPRDPDISLQRWPDASRTLGVRNTP
ncbi:MAG: carboxylic ester hydrolase [Candidatus Velthaea sp.]